MLDRKPKTNEEIEAEWRNYIKMKNSFDMRIDGSE